jgi:hypothetical protein
LVASKIKEVTTIFPTFEIKEVEIVIPRFAIKLKQVEKEDVVQKKAELNGIPKLMLEYTNKCSKYIYYHWVQQSSLLKGSSYSNSAIGHKFPILPTQCTLRYISTLGNLDNQCDIRLERLCCILWTSSSCEEVEIYVIEHYPDLIYFLESWSSYKKHRFVLLVRLERTPPSVWRLGLRRARLK